MESWLIQVLKFLHEAPHGWQAQAQLRGIIEGGCNGCSLLSLVLFCLWSLCGSWNQEITVRPQHGIFFLIRVK